jgi:antitoxin (DNA-binding transcriptional repressor) of toxin-antitoxin stability system
MKEISATEAARGFSALLDAVEHQHETFVVIRGGKSIARIEPATGTTGAAVKTLLLDHRPDARWSDELHELRGLTPDQVRPWPG